jgi:hypothetical protein
MYACIHETDSGFFAGGRCVRIGHLLFATHPTPRPSRTLLCQHTLSNDSHRNE